MGYATQIWAPQSIELIVKLERVQRRTTEFMLKLPFNISYKSRFQTLNLIPFCYWHELLDLTLFFKLTHGLERELLCPNLKFANKVDALDRQPAMLINT